MADRTTYTLPASGTNEIIVQAGEALIDASIIPYMRKREIYFSAGSMRPEKTVNFFFDETNVNSYVQGANKLTLKPANNASVFVQGDLIKNDVTHAYAKVIGSANNYLYVEENIQSLRIDSSLPSNAFNTGDIVFQTSTNTRVYENNTFVAKVETCDTANAVLVVSVLSGFADTTVASNNLYVLSNTTSKSNVTGFVEGTRWTADSKIFAVATPSTKFAVIDTTEHVSGSVVKTSAANTLLLYTQSNVSSLLVGNTINITSGGGIGLSRTISAINGNELVLSAAIPASTLNSTSKYSIGAKTVDDFGTIHGIFNLPEETGIRFLTGERLFTITDASSAADQDYTTKAVSKYVASGILGTSGAVVSSVVVNARQTPTPVTPIVPTPPVTRPPNPVTPTNRRIRRGRDPVAQTFFTPESGRGIFVSSVDLFFRNKPNVVGGMFPISVSIVTTDNGYPTEVAIATSSVECKNVKISETPSTSDPATATKFTFKDPVYLNAKTEYALVVFSESPDYDIWIAELGQNIIGVNPVRRVSEQPYIGSFFRSQNASTWTPFQNEDMMFVLRKCSFVTGVESRLNFDIDTPVANAAIDAIKVNTLELNFNPTRTSYSVKGKIVSSTPVEDVAEIMVTPSELYSFGSDLKTSSKASKRRRMLVAGDKNSLNVAVRLYSEDANVSPVINTERMSVVGVENIINDAGIANKDIIIVSKGSGYIGTNDALDGANAPYYSSVRALYNDTANLGFYPLTFTSVDAGHGATAFAVANTTGANTVDSVYVISTGSGYTLAPNVTISGTATLRVAGENGKSGGNMFAKHITKIVTLADGFDAGDLRVYLDTIRPSGTDIHVYYKVKSASDPASFNDKPWQLMHKNLDLKSPDQKTAIELEFRPSLSENRLSYRENGVIYPLGGTFKYFQIKICMTTQDPTVAPVVDNLRVIATPAG